MAVNVTSLMSTLSQCEDTTGWSAHNISGAMGTLAAIDATDEEMPPKEGTYCLTWDIDIENGGYYYGFSATDYSAKLVYFWASASTAANLEVSVPGSGQSGVYIIARDSSANYGYWHAGGSDTYKGGWRCFVADLSQAPDTNSGTAPNLANCDGIGLGFNHLGKSKATHNVYIDFLRVTDKGSGIKVTTDSASVADWEDIFSGDDGISAGVIRKEAGVYFVQGPIQFGDDTSGDMEFNDTSQVVIFESASVSDGHYEISVVGNSGGTIKFQMGNKSGARGIQGCTLKGVLPFKFTAMDTDIDEMKLYGSAFLNSGIVSLPPNASGREVIDCVFEECSEVVADTCVVTYCNFINADDRGVRMASTIHNITNCTFINCGHGVHVSVADTYSFTSMKFSNCTYDVENSTAGTVTINCDPDSDAGSYENTGGGSTSIVNTKTLEINGVKSLSVQITHGAISGDDGLFHVGYYLRGLTSGAVGRIVEAVDGTHTIVRVLSGTFSASETINETTDGTAGGDTGDSAATSAVVTEYVQCAIYALSGGPETPGTELMNEEATTGYGAAGFYKATEDYNYQGDQPVRVSARYQGWKRFEAEMTVVSTGLATTAVWEVDPNYGLP